MSEEKLSSHKLDIEGAQRLSSGEEKLKESYRQITEDIGLHATGDRVTNSNMVRENGDHVLDGADEKMLGKDDEKQVLAFKNVEVKFITGDQNQNGDAKIDIGTVEKSQTFTGMTKEELLKYANDPFWVKLRWVLFILFWGLWIAMLAGAISIIVFAPKCAAPTPNSWWKKGPLIIVDGTEDAERIKEIKEYNAKGVIYELSGDETYFVDTPLVENKIRKLINDYKANDIHVVLDLTANYVTKRDPLLARALLSDPDALDAFVTTDRDDNGWLKVGGSESAWRKEGKTFFLSQFNDNYDLQMTSSEAQNKLIGVLNTLTDYGVKGFRLNNAKHFIVSSDLSREAPSLNHNANVDEYDFYTHGKTVYQPGLGDVIHNFSKAVHNATGGDGFLTIRDDSAARAEVFVSHNTKTFGFDLPRFVFLNKFLKSSGAEIPKKIFTGFENLDLTIEKSTLWMQVAYKPDNFKPEGLDASAFNCFMGLLPGVQVTPIAALNYAGNKTEVIKKIEEARESQVFQHGKFDYLLSKNQTAFGYTRVKAGMPGYFVALNPTDSDVVADFTNDLLGSELSVWLLSDGFKDNQIKGKVLVNSVSLSKHSVAIFTFVPK